MRRIHIYEQALDLKLHKNTVTKTKCYLIFEMQVVAAMCSKVPFLSNAIMKATQSGRYRRLYSLKVSYHEKA